MFCGRRVDELILSFIGAIEAEGGLKSGGESVAMDENDASDVEFWNSLESTGVDRFQSIAIVPEKFSRGSRNPSRISRLMSSSSIVGKRCTNWYGDMVCGCSSRPAM